MFYNLKIDRYTKNLIEKIKSNLYISNKNQYDLINEYDNITTLTKKLSIIDVINQLSKDDSFSGINKIYREEIKEINKLKDDIISKFNNDNFSINFKLTIEEMKDIDKIVDELSYVIRNKIIKEEQKITKKVTYNLGKSFDEKLLFNFSLPNKIIDMRIKYEETNKESYKKRLHKLQKMQYILDRKIYQTINSDKKLNELKDKFNALISLSNQLRTTESTESIFDNLTIKEQIAMLDSNQFYKLNVSEVKQLTQAITNSYLKKMGIQPIPIRFHFNNESLGSCYNFGTYIELNGEYLNKFLEIKNSKSNSKYMQYQLLETIIHECRHCVQGRYLTPNKTLKFIQNAKNVNIYYSYRIKPIVDPYPEPMEHHKQYLSKLHEIDARDYSNKYLLDLSKYDIPNSKELENYVLFNIAKSIKLENEIKEENKYSTEIYDDVLKEALLIAKSTNVPYKISKSVYEIFEHLKLNDKNLIIRNEDKIDYEKTNLSIARNLSKEDIRQNEKKLKHFRETNFKTLFKKEELFNEYAEQNSLLPEEYTKYLEYSISFNNENTL